jgi:hypothetical protein
VQCGGGRCCWETQERERLVVLMQAQRLSVCRISGLECSAQVCRVSSQLVVSLPLSLFPSLPRSLSPSLPPSSPPSSPRRSPPNHPSMKSHLASTPPTRTRLDRWMRGMQASIDTTQLMRTQLARAAPPRPAPGGAEGEGKGRRAEAGRGERGGLESEREQREQGEGRRTCSTTGEGGRGHGDGGLVEVRAVVDRWCSMSARASMPPHLTLVLVDARGCLSTAVVSILNPKSSIPMPEPLAPYPQPSAPSPQP